MRSQGNADHTEFRDTYDAFAEAINAGRLSDNPQSPVHAGNFMYMGTVQGRDLFKNITTREYLK